MRFAPTIMCRAFRLLRQCVRTSRACAVHFHGCNPQLCNSMSVLPLRGASMQCSRRALRLYYHASCFPLAASVRAHLSRMCGASPWM